MGKKVITEADVIEAARAGGRFIEAPLGECIVTPGARDKALSLGIDIQGTSSGSLSSVVGTCGPASSETEDIVSQVTRLIKDRLPVDMASEKLSSVVRQVVQAHLSKSEPQSTRPKHNPDQTVTPSKGVCFVKGNMISGDLSGPIPVDEKVVVADAFKCSEDATLAGGYMQWSKASFSRTVDNNEVNVILDGELHLTVGGQTSVAEPGDMVYLAQGTEVTYSAPGTVKLACVNSVKG